MGAGIGFGHGGGEGTPLIRPCFLVGSPKSSGLCCLCVNLHDVHVLRVRRRTVGGHYACRCCSPAFAWKAEVVGAGWRVADATGKQYSRSLELKMPSMQKMCISKSPRVITTYV